MATEPAGMSADGQARTGAGERGQAGADRRGRRGRARTGGRGRAGRRGQARTGADRRGRARASAGARARAGGPARTGAGGAGGLGQAGWRAGRYRGPDAIAGRTRRDFPGAVREISIRLTAREVPKDRHSSLKVVGSGRPGTNKSGEVVRIKRRRAEGRGRGGPAGPYWGWTLPRGAGRYPPGGRRSYQLPAFSNTSSTFRGIPNRPGHIDERATGVLGHVVNVFGVHTSVVIHSVG
jgi:hypothetical protein